MAVHAGVEVATKVCFHSVCDYIVFPQFLNHRKCRQSLNSGETQN